MEDFVTELTPVASYAESRTGRGDAWFAEIEALKTKGRNLDKVAIFFENYADLVENGFSSVPLDEFRIMVRNEIVGFCQIHVKKAKAAAVRDRLRAQALENAGVDG